MASDLEKGAGQREKISDLVQGFIGLLAPDGTLLDINRSALAFVGAQREDVIGAPFWETPWWHDSPICQDQLQVAVVKAAAGKASRFEVFHTGRDGTTITVDFSLTPMVDTGRNVTSLVAEGRDITPLKDVSQALHKSELRLQLACDMAEIGTWSWDIESDILYWDERQFALFDVSHAKAPKRGEDAISSIHPQDQRRVRRAIMVAIERNRPLRDEFRVIHQNGDIRWLYASGDVVRNEKTNVTTMIGVNFDITARKMIEAHLHESKLDLEARFAERTRQLEREMQEHHKVQEVLAHAQRLEAVGQLAGGVAHDFNNLLAVIGGNLELAEMRTTDSSIEGLIHDALEAVEAGASLNRRLLSFARKRPVAPSKMVVNTRIETAKHLLARTLDENIRLRTALAPDIWEVFADAGEFDSAILNLAVNARDAMPGGGTLTVTTQNKTLTEDDVRPYPDTQPGDFVSIVVTDTGVGMSPDVLEKAITPFFTTKEAGKGSGLGLSSVFGFARQSGGFVIMQSAENVGTTVTICLPRAGQRTSDPAALTRQTDDNATGSGELVLVVEDDNAVRKITQERLLALGYTVLTAATADEAVGVLQDNPAIALIFSDIRMPGAMSGYDLAQWAHDNRPDIRVLLTSGYHTPVARDQVGRVSNRIRVLPKPYTNTTLAAALADVLGQPDPDG